MEEGYWNVLLREFLVLVKMMGQLLKIDGQQRLVLRCPSGRYYVAGRPSISIVENEASMEQIVE